MENTKIPVFLSLLERTDLYKICYILVVKNPPANAADVRDAGPISGSGRSPGGGHGNPLHFSFLENPMDRGTWQAAVHRVAQSWTRLKGLSTACIYITYAVMSGGNIGLRKKQALRVEPDGRSAILDEAVKNAFIFGQPSHMACGILVPWLGIEPWASSSESIEPYHCISRELPKMASIFEND